MWSAKLPLNDMKGSVAERPQESRSCCFKDTNMVMGILFHLQVRPIKSETASSDSMISPRISGTLAMAWPNRMAIRNIPRATVLILLVFFHVPCHGAFSTASICVRIASGHHNCPFRVDLGPQVNRGREECVRTVLCPSQRPVTKKTKALVSAGTLVENMHSLSGSVVVRKRGQEAALENIECENAVR